MKVVATYSIKGGVGKTSAAVNLGALAARAEFAKAFAPFAAADQARVVRDSFPKRP